LSDTGGPGSAVARPLGGRVRYVERARAGMREAVLDAVEELVGVRGWQNTRMVDVAGVAGVSRQTVYQLFGSREQLAQEYVLREADRFLRTVEDAMRSRKDDPNAAVVAALEAFLVGAADNLMVKTILSGDGNDGLLPLVTTHSLPLLDMARSRLAAVVAEVWPSLTGEDLRVFSDSVVRLAISHVTVAGGDPYRSARDIAKALGPFAQQALRAGAGQGG
jgi:AcrR family transcriptional regulator